MAIGANIRKLRERVGYTQEQLAQKIGVTAAAVGNYENDFSFPRAEVLYRIFVALDCQPNEIFVGNYEKSDSDEEHLMKYRSLDSYGKELIDACTEIEYRRCCGEERTMLIAARNGGAPREITVKKRPGAGSILDQPDYNGGRR